MDTPPAAADPERALGSRVVVRRRLDPPDAAGHSLSDVVGELVAVDAATLTVAGRGGEVVVPRREVAAFKVVPPRPSRRGAPHRALSVEDLERVMVDAWPPSERERLGDWWLRAAGGFTSRANSVLAVGFPGMPFAEAIDRVEEWYAARGLPAKVAIPGPVGFDPLRDPLGRDLAARGWSLSPATLALTASSSVVASAATTSAPGSAGTAGVGSAATVPGGRLPVEVDDVLTRDWLAAFARYRPHPHGVAEAVLLGSPAQRFATARDAGGAVVGIGRLAVAHAWGGIAAMWVDPEARGRGVGRQVLAALAGEALGLGAASLHLRADAGNAAALALYRREGFTAHHEYRYAVRNPGQSTRANCPR